MSRPELPRSSLGGGRSEAFQIGCELPMVVVGLWELVWLVLLLSGNGPQGQIWSVPDRWMAMFTLLGEHRPTGGLLWATWGVGTVAWVPVVLVVVGLLMVAYVALLWHELGLPVRERRQRLPKEPRRRGRRQPTAKAAADDLDDSLETFLAKQAAGRDD